MELSGNDIQNPMGFRNRITIRRMDADSSDSDNELVLNPNPHPNPNPIVNSAPTTITFRSIDIEEDDDSLINQIGNSLQDKSSKQTHKSGRGRGGGFGRGRGNRIRPAIITPISNPSLSIPRNNIPFNPSSSSSPSFEDNIASEELDTLSQLKGTGKLKDVVSTKLIGIKDVYPDPLEDEFGDSSCDEDKLEEEMIQKGIKHRKKGYKDIISLDKMIMGNQYNDFDDIIQYTSSTINQRRSKLNSLKVHSFDDEEDINSDYIEEGEEVEEGEELNDNQFGIREENKKRNEMKEDYSFLYNKKQKRDFNEKKCFLCFHGTFDNNEDKPIQLLKDCIRKLLGQTSKYAIARIVHMLFKRNIYIPRLKSGKEIDMWRTKEVYFHLTHCLRNHPEMWLVDNLESNQKLINYIQFNACLREEKTTNGGTRINVDHEAIKSLKTLQELNLKLYGQNPSKLNFYNGSIMEQEKSIKTNS